MTAKEHYDKHLGKVYSWMQGDFDTRMGEQKDLFLRHSVKPEGTGLAFDLGAGHGLQSVALATLGFHVQAVDFNNDLLAELKHNSKNLPIETTAADVMDFLSDTTQQPELIVCMGDTLTHFASIGDVVRIINRASDLLPERGKFIVSYRDLSTERVGPDRFLQVKSDAGRIMSCFLEYFPDKVIVYDIILENAAGTWKQTVSSYPKLRIPVSTFRKVLLDNSFAIAAEEIIGGMNLIIARKN